MNITSNTKICFIIGDPIGHSLSPQMHNAGYEALGIDDQFVFAAAHIKENDLEAAVNGFHAMGVRGITTTLPHKTTIMKYLDEIDETAKEIGAINTVVNTDGKLKGYNTDWIGVVKPLEQICDLRNKTAAVLGAGGAARAAVYGLTKSGVKVTIFNRTIEKAKQLAEDFNCEYATLDELEKITAMDIIFNATTIGLHPDNDKTPLPKELLNNNHIVFDAIYSPYQTQLLKDAEEKGVKVIHGLEMLLHQGLEQFKLYTGHEAPEEAMRKVLKSHAN